MGAQHRRVGDQFPGRDAESVELVRLEADEPELRQRGRDGVTFVRPVGRGPAPARAVGAARFVNARKHGVIRRIGFHTVAERRDGRLGVHAGDQALDVGRWHSKAAGRGIEFARDAGRRAGEFRVDRVRPRRRARHAPEKVSERFEAASGATHVVANQALAGLAGQLNSFDERAAGRGKDGLCAGGVADHGLVLPEGLRVDLDGALHMPEPGDIDAGGLGERDRVGVGGNRHDGDFDQLLFFVIDAALPLLRIFPLDRQEADADGLEPPGLDHLKDGLGLRVDVAAHELDIAD